MLPAVVSYLFKYFVLNASIEIFNMRMLTEGEGSPKNCNPQVYQASLTAESKYEESS